MTSDNRDHLLDLFGWYLGDIWVIFGWYLGDIYISLLHFIDVCIRHSGVEHTDVVIGAPVLATPLRVDYNYVVPLVRLTYVLDTLDC